ncbi:Hypothetical protein CpMEX30_1638 [Corynebacterium pseudotuberculosis]|nr:Hypothetical protein CpPAT10_1589 [Corynebacterium pseudotuberculosis PAT10]AEP70822.1 Hypothetical protein Cp4202_1578 [Corynebacterium pseudotuberculosis 42/02-A]AER69605.1 Hypothetical protein Cp106_1548 [Corynebacterium pseudotuberculosis 1/06-A]AFF22740.1 Hypothetical protein CpP54B96_1615 [Corynebacterium pseudotuberculosis P54B96]AFH52536.1 Hypothetical protein Cp267_1651 [Corynebacterium pseudotuberculosis 267]AJC14321.1 Hypothetical protein CpVD57_1619 [Corynebacterium pseudotuberc
MCYWGGWVIWGTASPMFGCWYVRMNSVGAIVRFTRGCEKYIVGCPMYSTAAACKTLS